MQKKEKMSEYVMVRLTPLEKQVAHRESRRLKSLANPTRKMGLAEWFKVARASELGLMPQQASRGRIKPRSL